MCYGIMHSIQHIKPVIHFINVSGKAVAQHIHIYIKVKKMKSEKNGGSKKIHQRF